MLIRFTVANYRSIKTPQTLSMAAAGGLVRLRDKNTFGAGTTEKSLPRLIKTAAIFGPNASGKSNIIKALKFVELMVINSADAKPESKVKVDPFRLNSACLKQDSAFEVEFVEEGVRYQFGFTANKDRITREWLISYPNARAQKLYERTYNVESNSDIYDFSRQLEGGKIRSIWADQTGPKTLYISRVVQASNESFKQLRTPYFWFSKRLRVIAGDASGLMTREFTSKVCLRSDEEKQKVIDFLRSFNLPIIDVKIKKKKFDFSQISDVIHPDVLEKVAKELEDRHEFDPIFLHEGDSGLVEFSAEDESAGTLNLFGFAAKWIQILKNNHVLVVDELDSSLHPHVVWELIRKMSENESMAQLIFTTHDATVLRSKLLRRDQVFFINQDSSKASNLYSLHDFKGREDEAFEDRYLNGEYGATPAICR